MTAPDLQQIVDGLIAAPRQSREGIWSHVVNAMEAGEVLEVGVWRGAFAEHLLRNCPTLRRYHMIDPWTTLEDWNKPANVAQGEFDQIYQEAMARTEFAGERRNVLRGRTLDMVREIPDGSLDLAYIDGDHTLRGITIDLVSTFPKVRPGGILAGDDYTRRIWQHDERFEPSLVCPFAAYFAESHGAPLVILPFNQFAIVKPAEPGRHFTVIDVTGRYGPRNLLSQVTKRA